MNPAPFDPECIWDLKFSLDGNDKFTGFQQKYLFGNF